MHRVSTSRLQGEKPITPFPKGQQLAHVLPEYILFTLSSLRNREPRSLSRGIWRCSPFLSGKKKLTNTCSHLCGDDEKEKGRGKAPSIRVTTSPPTHTHSRCVHDVHQEEARETASLALTVHLHKASVIRLISSAWLQAEFFFLVCL